MTDDMDDLQKTHNRTHTPYTRASDDAVDPDIALITDYLANTLSFDEEALVERRMRDDEKFFEKVWPLVRAWQQTEDTPISSRRVSRGVGTFTDEIRLLSTVRTLPGTDRPSWLARLGKLFRRRLSS
jgi:hypothetical protein